MSEIYNRKILDIGAIRWGAPPAPMLPQVLRRIWSPQSLPDWVCKETGLPSRSTPEHLSSDVWDYCSEMSPRLKHFLVFQLRSRSISLNEVKCFERPWPLGLKPADVGWSNRTRNSLQLEGLLKEEGELVKLTFGDLFRMKGMGAMSALDFCATLEGAMKAYEELVSNYPIHRSEPSHRDESQVQLELVQHNFLGHENETELSDLLKTLEETAALDWAEQISEQDPRFRRMLPQGRGTLQERIERLLSEPDAIANVSSVPALVRSIEQVRKYITELQDKSLESSLLEFLKFLSRAPDDRVLALAARFGWAGKEPETLEACGLRLGLTRERMRQIQERVINRIPTHVIFMPRLDQALSALEKRAPMKVTDAVRILRDMSITGEDFHPLGLLEAANLLRRETTLKIVDTPQAGKLLVNESAARLVFAIPNLARRLAGKSGIASVFQVHEAATEEGFEITETQIRQHLNGSPFDFLNDDWFWATDLKDSRNRLVNVTRKILSVASPQNVLTLRDGIRRLYRWRMLTAQRYRALIVPPASVLLEFYRRHPRFTVTDELVHTSEALDSRQELGGTEYVLAEVLRSAPSGILDRESFFQACLSRGMNENTFSAYSSYSPILEHLDLNVWKLRGVRVDTAAVEAMRMANLLKPREKRMLQYGWGADGSLWIALRVPRQADSMVVGCPRPLQRFLNGQEFRCFAREGNQDCGVVTVSDRGLSYGFKTFIRRYGVDENDILMAEFDINQNTVALSVGDEEILESEPFVNL